MVHAEHAPAAPATVVHSGRLHAVALVAALEELTLDVVELLFSELHFKAFICVRPTHLLGLQRDVVLRDRHPHRKR